DTSTVSLNAADLEREIHARRLAHIKVDARARGACELRLLRIDFITAGLKQRSGIEAPRAGLQIRNYSGGNIGNAYRYARDRGIGWIGDGTWTEAVCASDAVHPASRRHASFLMARTTPT